MGRECPQLDIRNPWRYALKADQITIGIARRAELLDSQPVKLAVGTLDRVGRKKGAMKRKCIGVYAIILFALSSILYAQEPPSAPVSTLKPIAVEEVTSDKKIERRLNEVLAAVGQYEHVKVRVLSGVVVFSGEVDEDRQIEWVGNLASRIDGVVAVQNRITSHPKKIFDVTLAREEMGRLADMVMHRLPTIVLALVVLVLFSLIFFIAFRGIRRAIARRISSPLLLNAIAKGFAIPVLLVGLYLALKISGLTGLAFTIMGGTGLFGLVLGLGLKNSFEDYAASIFLSRASSLLTARKLFNYPQFF